MLMTREFFNLVLIGIALSLGMVLTAVAQGDPETEIIRKNVEQIRAAGELTIDGTTIASVTVLPELYERNNFQLLWRNPDNVADLFETIKNVVEIGLDPMDYHWVELQRLRFEMDAEDSPEPALLVAYDLLLTDSLIRLGYHFNFGKVDPESLDPNWNLALEINDRDPAVFIDETLKAGDLARKFSEFDARHEFYDKLKSALKKYRTINESGGWEPVPDGPTLKKGMTDERVAMLRRRLNKTGDLAGKPSDSDVFDEELEQAVIHFQNRHFLDPDGAVGKNSLEAMNVTAKARIDQIRVNMERSRWVFHEISGKLIIVDIAGFQAQYTDNDDILWQSRVQVGKPYRKTPVFKADMKYLVFNPTWTVPPTILKKDVLPAIRKNPNYLKERNMKVIDHKGRTINQNTVDWSKYPKQRFPYLIRQEPGPKNALGLVKFMFPNKHLVYLHDTPSKSLFERADRAFSSGCIRVEKPFELAQLLLNDPAKWNRGSINSVIKSQKTSTVQLPEPVTVILLYWTVSIDDKGIIYFKNDVYQRDGGILKGLNDEFKFRERPFGTQRPKL